MTKMEINKIPKFKTVEEEAAFWDTHSFADYLSELKPSKARFSNRISEGITVRFAPSSLSLIRAEADERGVGATTLIRMWVMEHLKRQDQART